MKLVNDRNERIISELKVRCLSVGNIQPQRKTRARSGSNYDPNLFGIFSLGEEIKSENEPKIEYKSVEPMKRFKKEDTTLITMFGLLLGKHRLD